MPVAPVRIIAHIIAKLHELKTSCVAGRGEGMCKKGASTDTLKA